VLCNWWHNKPRRVNVVVDNDSWILPYANALVEKIDRTGDKAAFYNSCGAVQNADISFYLGCVSITPPEILTKSKKNLVVHESDLPKGKGFSPLSWQILEGKNSIPICLLEMAEKFDSGNVVLKNELIFEGHELVDELRKKQGEKTVELCLNYLACDQLPCGGKQTGEETFYKRRRPENSRLDVDVSIRENFNLLRIVDNTKYPAFFEINGYRYTLKITKSRIGAGN
jgi:methionyl-tRNA formyltransferase